MNEQYIILSNLRPLAPRNSHWLLVASIKEETRAGVDLESPPLRELLWLSSVHEFMNSSSQRDEVVGLIFAGKRLSSTGLLA